MFCLYLSSMCTRSTRRSERPSGYRLSPGSKGEKSIMPVSTPLSNGTQENWATTLNFYNAASKPSNSPHECKKVCSPYSGASYRLNSSPYREACFPAQSCSTPQPSHNFYTPTPPLGSSFKLGVEADENDLNMAKFIACTPSRNYGRNVQGMTFGQNSYSSKGSPTLIHNTPVVTLSPTPNLESIKAMNRIQGTPQPMSI